MRLHLIFARSRNGVIGRDNALPWHLPEDLAHFKRCTLGCPVIMGRKTWDSLPARFKPLPGRSNIVLSRQPGWHAAGATVAADLDAALVLCADAPDAWVIGGAQLYALALEHAHSAEVTEIDTELEGDAFAPSFGPQWREVRREEHVATSGQRYRFISLQHLPGV